MHYWHLNDIVYFRLHLACDFLKAKALPDGRYVYRDDATQSDWIVTSEQLADLGLRLVRRDDDAYSAWCSDTSAQQVAS
jgi:hypothetical protein